MQVKASITHTVYFEVQEGTSIEAIRAQALGEIDDRYGSDDGEGSTEDKVTDIIENALAGCSPRSASTEIQVTEVK